MGYFSLPESTKVQRVIPKNAFDKYTNSKQKKAFTDLVQKITWKNKLSKDTINLHFQDIQEVQIFEIQLKRKEDISSLLDIIDKAIPYQLIFKVQYGEELFLSTAQKHPHPVYNDQAVLDWRFESGWFNAGSKEYHLTLKKNLDFVVKDFCLQLLGKEELEKASLVEIVENQQKIAALQNEIERLKTKISKCKQFKEKVELNLELNRKIILLDKLF
jgi:uncharacterized small protein (DUF1192 family)